MALSKRIKELKKQIELKELEREETKIILFNKLMLFCKFKNLNVFIEGENQRTIDSGVAGVMISYTIGGYYISSPNEHIVLSLQYQNNPFVLAHEIGHYLQLRQELKTDEIGADQYADKLCREVLTGNEQEILKISLECYFKNNINIKGVE